MQSPSRLSSYRASPVLAFLAIILTTKAFSGTPIFAPPTTIPIPTASSQLVALADLNGDGKLDLVVGMTVGLSYPNGAIAILLGNGDGTFQPAIQYQAGNLPAFALADVNNDGKLDVVAIDACPPAGTGQFCNPAGEVEVFLGNGDGTLQPSIISANEFLGEARNIAVADLDGDGVPDLASTFGFVYSLPLHDSGAAFRGNGDGTFSYWSGFEPSSLGELQDLVAGDFNGDGKIDLAVLRSRHGYVDILLGNGDGSFSPASSFPVGHARRLTTADLNGDGHLDIAVTNGSGVRVAYGNGDGTFQTSIGLVTTTDPDPRQVIAGDFNGDGRLDLAVALGSNDLVAVYINRPNGGFQKILFATPGGPVNLATGDLNQDGYLDIVTGNGTTASLDILLNTSATTVTPSQITFPRRTVGTSSAPRTVTLKNSGRKTLNIRRIAITGPSAGSFSRTYSCGSTLTPGASCSIIVKFDPKRVGTRTAALTVSDDGVGSPQAVALSGIGTTP